MGLLKSEEEAADTTLAARRLAFRRRARFMRRKRRARNRTYLELIASRRFRAIERAIGSIQDDFHGFAVIRIRDDSH